MNSVFEMKPNCDQWYESSKESLLYQVMDKHSKKDNILIFSENLGNLIFLNYKLQTKRPDKNIIMFHGGLSHKQVQHS